MKSSFLFYQFFELKFYFSEPRKRKRENKNDEWLNQGLTFDENKLIVLDFV